MASQNKRHPTTPPSPLQPKRRVRVRTAAERKIAGALPRRGMSGEPKAGVVLALLDWFSSNARALPWRRTRDPYAVWVSEIMLQQTQVKTVLPYWIRWMRELPTIRSLACADLGRIHKLWEGLGYYSRVRNMQKAARLIVGQYRGEFPQSFEAILSLPGIGPYTAGAMCSIAFNQPRAILDGNVIRVLTRLWGISGHPRDKATNAQLWRLSSELVEAAAILGRSGAGSGRKSGQTCSAFNQALMELGALVCKPREPLCAVCPVRVHCVAYRTGQVEQLPNLGRRPTRTARRFIAFIAQHRGRYLVRQRPAGAVNGHLWEFPNVEVGPNDEINSRKVSSLGRRHFNLTVARPRPFRTINHTITRYRIALEAFQGNAPGSHCSRGHQWLTLEEIDKLPFTSAHRKLVSQLQGSPFKFLKKPASPSVS